jgi:hypothetical protein
MSKTIVVGDVHGCIDELHDLLLKCEYNEFLDNLVFVGDLVGKVIGFIFSYLNEGKGFYFFSSFN